MRILKTISLNIIIFLGLFTFIEFIFRLTVDFNANYYGLDSRKRSNSENVHPYGTIPINSNKFYDNEWDEPKQKERFAFFGDSVIYGVGAGYPYRITEYLDELRKEVEHVNISGGLGANFLTLWGNEKISEIINDKNIDKLIYVMNLNDISPLTYQVKDSINYDLQAQSKIANLMKSISSIDQGIRGQSVFYTFLRFHIKNFLVTRYGLNASGYSAIELEPLKFKKEIKLAGKNLAILSNKLLSNNIQMCVIIIPYEMQISKDASKKYRNLGVIYENQFLNFKTQEFFVEGFREISNAEIEIIGKNFPEKKAGTYFVYNLGDKIDFNHPNRLGHKFLAEEISERNICY